MKLLLDENLPKRLKLDLKEFEISTVSDNGWAEILSWLTTSNFELFPRPISPIPHEIWFFDLPLDRFYGNFSLFQL